MSSTNGRGIISKSMKRQSEWSPLASSKPYRATNLYGIGPFGIQFLKDTGRPFQTEIFNSIDSSFYGYIDFLNRDELNRHFYGEIGAGIKVTPEKIEDLLRYSGCGRNTKVIDVHDCELPKKRNRTYWTDKKDQISTIEWEAYPRKLKNNLPLPLVDRKSIKEFEVPLYLWKEKTRDQANLINHIMTFPPRYDYDLTSSYYNEGEMVVNYNHRTMGRLTGMVPSFLIKSINKQEVDNNEVFNNIYFESNGSEKDFTQVYLSGMKYRRQLREANTLDERIEIMGYDSLKDYLLCSCV